VTRTTAAVMAWPGFGSLRGVSGQLISALLAVGNNYINGTSGSPDPLSTSALIGIFAGIPAASVLFIAGLTLRARGVGALQYRPGKPWAYGQEQFGARSADGQVRVAVPGSGGASARW
jgi:hypothetical protein